MSQNQNMILDKLEFEGGTVLCRVCGDKASGFHYGVHACEGCKGFFRRSIQQKIQYRPCIKNQQCKVIRMNRNRCQYCRLKKCIAVGMSRDAVRFGRVPKREKAKILEQMKRSMAESDVHQISDVLGDMSSMLYKIIDAHHQNSQFTKQKVAQLLTKSWEEQRYITCPTHMACPLNPRPTQDCSPIGSEIAQMFAHSIRSVVAFAKNIPGFMYFNQDDQVTLLKAATFEVLLLQMSPLFSSQRNILTFADGKLFKRTNSNLGGQAGFLIDSMFEFAERINALDLTDEEIAVFSAVIIISSDRPGLRSPSVVQKVEMSVRTAFEQLIQAVHPEEPDIVNKVLGKVPDLRTLNTLHSEKLMDTSVAFPDPSVAASHDNLRCQVTPRPAPQHVDNPPAIQVKAEPLSPASSALEMMTTIFGDHKPEGHMKIPVPTSIGSGQIGHNPCYSPRFQVAQPVSSSREPQPQHFSQMSHMMPQVGQQFPPRAIQPDQFPFPWGQDPRKAPLFHPNPYMMQPLGGMYPGVCHPLDGLFQNVNRIECESMPRLPLAYNTNSTTKSSGSKSSNKRLAPTLSDHANPDKMPKLLPISDIFGNGSRSSSWSSNVSNISYDSYEASSLPVRFSLGTQAVEAEERSQDHQSESMVNGGANGSSIEPMSSKYDKMRKNGLKLSSSSEGLNSSVGSPQSRAHSVLRHALALPPLQHQDTWFHRSSSALHRATPPTARQSSPVDLPIRSKSFVSSFTPGLGRSEAFRMTRQEESAVSTPTSAIYSRSSIPNNVDTQKTFKLKRAFLDRLLPEKMAALAESEERMKEEMSCVVSKALPSCTVSKAPSDDETEASCTGKGISCNDGSSCKVEDYSDEEGDLVIDMKQDSECEEQEDSPDESDILHRNGNGEPLNLVMKAVKQEED